LVVDVHAHYYPTKYVAQLGRPDLPPLAAAALAGQTIAERLLLMDEMGIDIAVLSVSQAQPYLDDPAHAADVARLANDSFLDLCRRHPHRFRMFAALPLPHVEQALAELDRVASDPAVVGITIGCSVGPYTLDDPRFDPLYARLDAMRAVVFLHPIGREQDPWLRDHNLAWLVGAPFEDTVAALRLVQAGIPARYPRLRIIVPHLGGTLPFLAHRLTAKQGAVSLLDGLQTFFYDTVNGHPLALGAAAAVFGPDRLLFGTDYPYATAAQLAHHLEYLSEPGWDDATLSGVRGGHAAQLLSLA